MTRAFTTDSIHKHPAYNPVSLDNDIALINIQKVGYTKNIAKIKLPSISNYYENYDDRFATVSGVGSSDDSKLKFVLNKRPCTLH